MKKFTKIVLAAALVFAAGTSVTAQTAAEDPRYGDTPEARQANLLKLNFLRDEYNNRSWDGVADKVRELMNDAPKATANIYIYGATAYKNKLAATTDAAQKQVYLDSIMLIYDRRAENFGPNATNGTPIAQLKAQDYLVLNPMDRAGIRKLYQEALAVAGENAKSDLILRYFQELVTDYKGVEVSPEELLTTYQQLQPLMEKNATAEERDTFTGLFVSSGVADCNVLEELYTKELADKPGDVEVLTKAYNLMTMASCESPFYISVAEQYYAAKPSSEVAIRLATMFEKSEQFDSALKYLNEMIATESDPAAKANLYVRVAASELGLRHSSAAATAARQAIALDSSNGLAHMFLGEAYIGGASGCSGFAAQTVFWLAADALARARDAFEGDAAMIETVNNRLANCRANFPTFEDGFMNVQGYANGNSYTVSCGWVSGTTTIRSR